MWFKKQAITLLKIIEHFNGGKEFSVEYELSYKPVGNTRVTQPLWRVRLMFIPPRLS